MAASLGAQPQPQRSMFVFQNPFWLNLHQFLRGEGYRRSIQAAPGLDPASLSEKDRAIWISALDGYEENRKRDLIFDEGLRRIANTLAVAGDVEQLPASAGAALGSGVAAALNAAAPIYRATVWPARRRDNDAWAASAKSLLDRHESAVKPALEAALHATWPPEPILVSVVGECGPNSAITHDGPKGFAAHTQASAGSLRNTGNSPLELLFHEATHIPQVGGRISTRIMEESERQKLAPARDLWHTLLLFTPGILVRRELAQTEGVDYITYSARYNQITPVEKAALERDWQPYLEGKTSFEEALHDLVRDAR